MLKTQTTVPNVETLNIPSFSERWCFQMVLGKRTKSFQDKVGIVLFKAMKVYWEQGT